jgi:hypothetical protein
MSDSLLPMNHWIVQSGPARELLDSEEVRKAYMGM